MGGSPWLRLAAAALLVAVPRPARADPEEGEARSILRDVDRPYTVVAGEADGAATVTNPANLGYLRAMSGVLDLAFTRPGARRRGSGVSATVGIPIFGPGWFGTRREHWASLGLGFQFLMPNQPADPGEGLTPSPGLDTADESFSKLTVALAIPLSRWLPGVSVALGYSRLLARANLYARGVNQLDVGLSFWAGRFLALGLVGRGLNQPETGEVAAAGGTGTVVQPLALDPELAFRPLGTRVLELAVGMRAYPTRRIPVEPRFRVGLGDAAIEPHGRLLVQGRGVRFFAEAQTYRYFPVRAPGQLAAAGDRSAVSLSAGFELDFAYLGVGGGPLLGFAGSRTAGADGGTARVRISAERYDGFVVRPRQVTRLELAGMGGDRGMWRAVQALDFVAEHRGVALVQTRGMSLGYAQLEEIREAILRVRDAGGKVMVYMEGGGLGAYFLASAGDRVVAHPTRGLDITGMRGRTFYFAELLAKLGARAEFLRIAEYKGVPETYHRSTASEPVRRQRRQARADVWNHVLRLIARERGHDPLVVRRWIDQAPLPPPRAQRLGVVDALAYPDELDEVLERWLGKPVRLAAPGATPEHDGHFGRPLQIAVLEIEGDLLDGASAEIPLLGTKIAGAATLTREIDRLRKDPTVRAVVVRCNTPGGSVSAADDIARALDELRRRKPVVISMGSACASGGYYIATAGQYIVADATTLTGSIGIFYPKMDLSGTLEKFGVGVDEEGLGRHALMRSWWKPYDESEREAAMDDIRFSYDVFIERVGRARSMKPQRVDETLARGRVWSGVRATEVGLVDRYGGLREAILRAKAIAGLGRREVAVRLVPKPPSLGERVTALLGIQIPSPLAGAARRRGRGRAPAAALADPLAHLPLPVVQVLRHLSPALWMAAAPAPLALDPEPFEIE